MLRTTKPSTRKKSSQQHSLSNKSQSQSKLSTKPTLRHNQKRTICKINGDPLRSSSSPIYNQVEVQDTMLRGSLLHTSNLLHQGVLKTDTLIESTIEQIKDTNPLTNTFISTSFQQALDDADQSIERYINKQSLSPIDGIPISIKDNFHVKSLQTTAGSQFLKGFTSPYNATIVQRLQNAGAIIIGKTNMDEFGMGSYGTNSSYLPTKSIFVTENKNDSNYHYVPGGSSSGSATSLQSYTSFGSIGSDTGGSVRLPAAYTGTVGFKPTYGALSRYGLIAYGSSLDCPGIMARSVMDVKIMYDIVAGPDEMDSTCIFDTRNVLSHFPQLQQLLPKINNTNGSINTIQHQQQQQQEQLSYEQQEQLKLKPFQGLKVGIPIELMFSDLSTEIKSIWNNTSTLLQELGAEVYSISIPTLSNCLPIYYVLAQSEAVSNLARYDGLRYGSTHYTNDVTYQTNFYQKINENEPILHDINVPLHSTPKSSITNEITTQPYKDATDAIKNRSIIVGTHSNSNSIPPQQIPSDSNSISTDTININSSSTIIPSNSNSNSNATPLQKLYSTNRELFFGPEVKSRLLVGNFVLSSSHYSSYIEKAMALRQELTHEFLDALYSTQLTHNERFHADIISQTKVDIILCPTSTVLPPQLQQQPSTAITTSTTNDNSNSDETNNDMNGYIDDVMTVFANLVGAPALSIPAAAVQSEKNGHLLPVGMQLIGAPCSDKQLLDIGAVLQQHIKF